MNNRLFHIIDATQKINILILTLSYADAYIMHVINGVVRIIFII